MTRGIALALRDHEAQQAGLPIGDWRLAEYRYVSSRSDSVSRTQLAQWNPRFELAQWVIRRRADAQSCACAKLKYLLFSLGNKSRYLCGLEPPIIERQRRFAPAHFRNGNVGARVGVNDPGVASNALTQAHCEYAARNPEILHSAREREG